MLTSIVILVALVVLVAVAEYYTRTAPPPVRWGFIGLALLILLFWVARLAGFV